MSKSMVQFALVNPYENLVDTDPIDADEAEEKFRNCLPMYREVLTNQPWREPELALWIDCESDTDYHATKYHLSAHDTEIDASGILVQVTKTYF